MSNLISNSKNQDNSRLSPPAMIIDKPYQKTEKQKFLPDVRKSYSVD